MKNDYCTAFLSAEQLLRLIDKGADLEVFSRSHFGEPKAMPWRALLDLTKPSLVAQFLDIVISPSMRFGTEPKRPDSFAAPQYLLVSGHVHAAHEGLFISHFAPVQSTHCCLAFLTAQQLSGAVDQGAKLKVFDLVAPTERTDGLRSASLYLDEPSTVAMFLGVLSSPAAVIEPALRQQEGIAPPKKLQVFGFIQEEQGGFFVSEFMPYT